MAIYYEVNMKIFTLARAEIHLQGVLVQKNIVFLTHEHSLMYWGL
jgi:hypothetical protein